MKNNNMQRTCLFITSVLFIIDIMEWIALPYELYLTPYWVPNGLVPEVQLSKLPILCIPLLCAIIGFNLSSKNTFISKCFSLFGLIPMILLIFNMDKIYLCV